MSDDQSLRLDRFMAAANSAYYANKDPFSDFITAPEISQMFGELIAAWVIVVMRSMDYQERITLIEAGPGCGTLMADILRVMRKAAPDLYARCAVLLVETSPRLREIQKQALADYGSLSIQWLDLIENIPKTPIVFLANEFLDALPIRQFVHVEQDKWAEHYVYHHDVMQKPIEQLPKAPAFKRPIPIGGIVEVCEAGQQVVQYIAQSVCHHGGAALFIDYGYTTAVWGDSLQAIAGKQKVSPFVNAGEADLTAHIDFGALKEIAADVGAAVYGIQTQGEFLRQLGLILRANSLAARTTKEQRQEIYDAVYRLSDPKEMGELFKVMAVCHPKLSVPPAFELKKETIL